MLLPTCTRLFCLWLLLAAVLRLGSLQNSDDSRSKVNAIKSSLTSQDPTQASNNRSAVFHSAFHSKKGVAVGQVYPCSNDKECSIGSFCHSPQKGPTRCLACRRKKKRCNRNSMCCPGNHCSNGICIANSESILTAHIPVIDGHNKKNGQLTTRDMGWQNIGKTQSKLPHVKGHEGDSCLRSSDCAEGFCCARHFWTKICKPVLQQGEVCTKQRKKGSHGLEIFQRCDCAKGLSCKIWKDATSSSKSRLHVCQKI
ncbi:dickkopf-related protein 2 [Polypterus senegalus]|uniref:dickkopf-related protein 2 n=1 Tax=Polypterus senegalus TaxID=55291 RepID=UPI00196245F3|nr:dickkopf-related protein 2 [Polypterus senegalus]